MKGQIRILQIFLVCLLVFLSACSGVKKLPTPARDEIKTLGDNCTEIVTRQIDAWASKDTDNFNLVYTNDVVHFDSGPVFVGIDEVIHMAKNVLLFLPYWKMKAGKTFISIDQCMGTWINWDMFDLTEDNPGVEYDLLDVRDKKISYWHLFSNENLAGPDQIDMDFISKFFAAWSSADQAEISQIYAADATLRDSLFGISANGQEAIQDYAASFLAKTRSASWEIISPFAESPMSSKFVEQYPFPSQGLDFSVTLNPTKTNACRIHMLVIITPNADGLIQNQKVFYNADSLLACGWAK